MFQGTGVDQTDLNDRLRHRMETRGHNPADVARVDALSLSPLDSGKWGFDAAATSELFEKQVPPPDFRSWKFRFIRGPLKPLARYFYKLIAQMFDRMSENKTQAFYNVVHELADLRRENAQLKERIANLEASRAGAIPAERQSAPETPDRPANSISQIPEARRRGFSGKSGNIPRPL